MENWRELFKERFVIEENVREQYLRKYDHRTIVEELEHFIEQEIEKAKREAQIEVLTEIFQTCYQEDSKTLELVEEKLSKLTTK